MINNLKQKAPIQVSLTGEFHQTFMEEIPIEKKIKSYNFLQNVEG